MTLTRVDSSQVRHSGRDLNDWLDDHVLAADYGAVGDGVTDDSAALVAAQAAAEGRDIVLRGGKTYRINSALVFTGDTSIRSDSAEKAVIYHAGQDFVPLTVQGTSPGSQFLTAGVTVGSRAWAVGSAASVSAGMLMAVKSSESWYHDPRPGSTDTRKSELHRVESVVGNVIYVEDGANDGYDTASETVTLIFYAPAKVRIQNIVVRCVLPAAAPSTDVVSGIEIYYADEPLLRDVDVENAAGKGIGVTECYRPVIEGGHTLGANYWGTGYGVQTAGTSHAAIRNRRFARCRRGVDISGANIISRDTLIEGCVVHGGGKNSQGTDYGWAADGSLGADQQGFGSHGASDVAVYRDNFTNNLHNHYACRGRNEVIENNTMIGRARMGVIAVSYGENLIVRNNVAYDGRYSLKDNGIYDVGGNINTRRADYFLRFSDTYDGKAVGQITVEGNDVMVQDQFIQFTYSTQSAVCNNVTIRNNRVRFATSTGSTQVYLANNTDAALGVPSGWLLDGNDLARQGGTGRINTLGNLDLRDQNSSFNIQRSYSLFLSDDTATSVAIPMASTVNAVRVIVDAQGSAEGCVQVTQGSTAQDAIGTPANLLNATGVLAGTTGTDANLNLSLQDGKLYVENRLGLTRRVLLTIVHAF